MERTWLRVLLRGAPAVENQRLSTPLPPPPFGKGAERPAILSNVIARRSNEWLKLGP
jgi:hypothetical protein